MDRQWQRIGSMGLAAMLWLLSLLIIPRSTLAQGGVIITEVAFKVTNGQDWAEIYNTGSVGVDISGYKLTDLDGTDTAFATSTTTLGPGKYAVIHWKTTGTDETDAVGDLNGNGWTDLYVDDTDLTGTDDQLVLVNNSGVYIDAVIWSNNDQAGDTSEWADFNALAPAQWNYSDVSSWDEYNARSWTDSDDISAGETLARYLDPGTPVYADSNQKTDWYHEATPTQGGQNDETVVELAFFTAAGHAGCVRLDWQTTSEMDNAGFNLWRSDAADGPYTQLNATLIPALGGPILGVSYSYTDTAVTGGHAYFYQLEDVDTHGASTFYGPVTATAGGVYRQFLPLVAVGY